MAKRLMLVPTPSSLIPMLAGRALSDSVKTEALLDGFEAQLQPVNDPIDHAIAEKVIHTMRAYEHHLLSEPN
jgi:hypothetical protein